MFLSTTTVTLNIEANSLRLLVFKGKRAFKWGSVPLSPELIKEGVILDPQGVGLAIAELLKSNEISTTRPMVSLSGLHSVLRIVSLPKTPRALMGEAVERYARKIMPVDLEELYLSWQVVGTWAGKQKVFVLGIPKKLIDAGVEALRLAGISQPVMELKPVALARAANHERAIVLCIEPQSLDIVVVAHGIPAAMRTICAKPGCPSPRERVEEMVEELHRTISLYAADLPQHYIEPDIPLFLVGEDAAEPELRKLLQEEVEYPVMPLPALLKYPPSFPASEFAGNIGLGLSRARPSRRGRPPFRPISLNILPQIYRPRSISTTQVLVALLLIVGAGSLLPLYRMDANAYSQTADLQSQMSSLEQRLQGERLSLRRMGQLQTSVDQTLTLVESLQREYEAILSQRGAPARLELILEFAHAFGVRLTAIADTGGEITLGGQADGNAEAVSFARALDQTGAFSQVNLVSLTRASGADPDQVAFTVKIAR